MTAPERRRPLPALAFIAALTVLTALVWFRVIHRTDSTAGAAGPSCSTTTSATPNALTVLPVPGKVQVAVLNSTEKRGLAKGTKKLLEAKGFTVTVATDDAPAYGGHGIIKTTGEIRFGPTSRAAATILHYYLPTAKMVVTDQSTPVVYLALGTAFKTLRTQAVVQKALTNAHVKLTRGALPTADPSAGAGC